MTAPVCATDGCGQPARARVVSPMLAGVTGGVVASFAIVRPLASPVSVGVNACLDCCHAAVDDMLMAATPPGPGPDLEQLRDPT